MHTREEKFKSFLEKLKTEENKALIESVQSGFEVLIEAEKTPIFEKTEENK